MSNETQIQQDFLREARTIVQAYQASATALLTDQAIVTRLLKQMLSGRNVFETGGVQVRSQERYNITNLTSTPYLKAAAYNVQVLDLRNASEVRVHFQVPGPSGQGYDLTSILGAFSTQGQFSPIPADQFSILGKTRFAVDASAEAPSFSVDLEMAQLQLSGTFDIESSNPSGTDQINMIQDITTGQYSGTNNESWLLPQVAGNPITVETPGQVQITGMLAGSGSSNPSNFIFDFDALVPCAGARWLHLMFPACGVDYFDTDSYPIQPVTYELIR